MSISLKMVKNSFEKYRSQLLEPERKVAAFFQSTLYPMYQEAQFQRWKTEGASEGMEFKEAQDKWIKRKERQKEKDSDKYPGGSKRLVYTGALAGSAVGPISGSEFSNRGQKWHRKTITPKSMVVATTAPYAQHVVDWMGEDKSFMKFSRETMGQFKSALQTFMWREFGK